MSLSPSPLTLHETSLRPNILSFSLPLHRNPHLCEAFRDLQEGEYLRSLFFSLHLSYLPFRLCLFPFTQKTPLPAPASSPACSSLFLLLAIRRSSRDQSTGFSCTLQRAAGRDKSPIHTRRHAQRRAERQLASDREKKKERKRERERDDGSVPLGPAAVSPSSSFSCCLLWGSSERHKEMRRDKGDLKRERREEKIVAGGVGGLHLRSS